MTPTEASPSLREIEDRIVSAFSSARRSAGMTQTQVAALIGVSQSKLSKIEHGILVPSIFDWIRFCSLMQISADPCAAPRIENVKQTEQAPTD